MRKIKDYALYLLGRRDYGTYELKQKLTLKGYELEDIDAIIGYFTEIGYLNDGKLIERLIIYLINKQKSKRQVEAYLIGKGFRKDLVKIKIDEKCFEEYEADILDKLISRYLNSSKTVPKEKIIMRLQNKGFSYKSIVERLDKS